MAGSDFNPPEVSPHNLVPKASEDNAAAGGSVSVRRKKGKMKQRNRRGDGCVYRPKYKTETGQVREGRWRIKFTYKDSRTGEKKAVTKSS